MEIIRTTGFTKWFKKLSETIKDRVRIRVLRLGDGNFGDCHTVGGYVSELRIDYGVGYRIYFTKKGDEIIVLLAGGTKQGQNKDIEKAKEMAREWRKQNG